MQDCGEVVSLGEGSDVGEWWWWKSLRSTCRGSGWKARENEGELSYREPREVTSLKGCTLTLPINALKDLTSDHSLTHRDQLTKPRP